MIEALILYGSKARNDGATGSDTDLLGIFTSGQIEKVFDDRGISFHKYPLSWMLEQSKQGSLFLLHITHEAVPIFDPYNLLDKVKVSFIFKLSYKEEIAIGARIILAVIRLNQNEFSEKIKVRYFWGLRTLIMATAANERKAIFSAQALERFCGITGLSKHIQGRRHATLIDCKKMGLDVISAINPLYLEVLRHERAKNLETLLTLGGIAAATAGEIIYGI